VLFIRYVAAFKQQLLYEMKVIPSSHDKAVSVQHFAT